MDRQFKRHLENAGLVRIDGLGRKVDFHALRYTFATKLAKSGVSQRLAQELMRHSDPRLTAKIYTDATQLPTYDAVKQLEWSTEESTTVRKSGTQIGTQTPDFSGHSEAQTDKRKLTLNIRKYLKER